jgi:hypothetical protein
MTLIETIHWVAAAELEKEVGAKTIAASDGMKLDLKEV